MEITIDYERAEQVLSRLLEVYQAKEYPFNRVDVPQADVNLPKNMPRGGDEHAHFLFYTCYWMRGGIKSDTAIWQLARLYEKDPRFFVPKSVMHRKPENIVASLESVGLGAFKFDVTRFMRLNARKLIRHWNASPLQIFGGVNSYEELVERFDGISKKKPVEKFLKSPKGFYGFREKMVSMLLYFYIDAGMLSDINYPIPVDFHVLRILVSTGALSGPRDIERLDPVRASAKARDISVWYCERHGVSMRELCNTLWLYSRTVCSIAPGNGSQIGRYHGRKTTVVPEVLQWTPSQLDRHIRSCGTCPVRSSCEIQVPSGNYYRQGVVQLRPRATPEQTPFGFIDQS